MEGEGNIPSGKGSHTRAAQNIHHSDFSHAICPCGIVTLRDVNWELTHTSRLLFTATQFTIYMTNHVKVGSSFSPVYTP